MHVPAGAIPKDGPSAGITMTTALTSLLTGRPVKHTVGMTGEVTLQGRVLPIGGLKQKVLAAHAAGLTEVILPERNRGDLDDVPDDVREAMTFHPVMTIDEVLELALEPAPRRWQRGGSLQSTAEIGGEPRGAPPLEAAPARPGQPVVAGGDRPQPVTLFPPYRRQLITLLVLILFSAGLGIVSPFLLRAVLDTAIPKDRTDCSRCSSGGWSRSRSRPAPWASRRPSSRTASASS